MDCREDGGDGHNDIEDEDADDEDANNEFYIEDDNDENVFLIMSSLFVSNF